MLGSTGCDDFEANANAGSATSDSAHPSDKSDISTPDHADDGSSEDVESSQGSGSQSDPEQSDDGGQSKDASTDDIDWAQQLEHVFPSDHVVELRLTFAENGLVDMVDEWNTVQTKSYYEASVAFDDESLDSSGVRLKGYSSLLFGHDEDGGGGDSKLEPHYKLPLKLNFDRFGGPRFHHLDRVGLGNNVWDTSLMRERLSYRLYAAMDIPAPRTAYYAVHVDEHYAGLYTATQSINKRFLKQHFGTAASADDGNLYKCTGEARRGGQSNGPFVCSLSWRGDSKTDYLLTDSCNPGFDECGYVLKTNEDSQQSEDYGDLIDLIDVIEHASDDEFPTQLEARFDVDAFLRLLAVTAVMSSYDSYIGRVNNYYLYHRPDTNTFMMLPWDLNMSYGLYHCGRGPDVDLMRIEVEDPSCKVEGGPDAYPLVDRVLAVDSWATRYADYISEFLDQHFTVENHERWIAEFDGLIGELVGADPNYPHSEAEYQRSLSAAASEPDAYRRRYNILEFVEGRRAYLQAKGY